MTGEDYLVDGNPGSSETETAAGLCDSSHRERDSLKPTPIA